MKVKNVPTFTPTSQQREWLEEEKRKTGNSFATIMKGLLQEKADKKAKRK